MDTDSVDLNNQSSFLSVSLTDTVRPVKAFCVGFTTSGWSDLCLGEIYYAFLWLASDARCTYCSDYILFITSTLTLEYISPVV